MVRKRLFKITKLPLLPKSQKWPFCGDFFPLTAADSRKRVCEGKKTLSIVVAVLHVLAVLTVAPVENVAAVNKPWQPRRSRGSFKQPWQL